VLKAKKMELSNSKMYMEVDWYGWTWQSIYWKCEI
jgi:hypothetical protein